VEVESDKNQIFSHFFRTSVVNSSSFFSDVKMVLTSQAAKFENPKKTDEVEKR
jgi:hypothetical protein